MEMIGLGTGQGEGSDWAAIVSSMLASPPDQEVNNLRDAM